MDESYLQPFDRWFSNHPDPSAPGPFGLNWPGTGNGAAQPSPQSGNRMPPHASRPLHIHPVTVSDDDLDAAVRTVWGEARGEGLLGEQAVAGVLRNRALITGKSIMEIATAPHMFSGYNALARALPKGSPAYQSIKANIEGVLRGTMTNPAGNSTYYFNPEKTPKPWPNWATDYGPGQRIGHHVFFQSPFPGIDDQSLPPPPPGVFGQLARPLPGSEARTNITLGSAPKPSTPDSITPDRNGGPGVGFEQHAVPPRADLTPDQAALGFPPSGPPMTAAGSSSTSQPGAPDPAGQPQPQGALNAAPPQGGLPAGLGDYLYGPGAPAAGHAGPTPLEALALNARPPGQGVLNAPPMLAAQSGMGADVADPDAP